MAKTKELKILVSDDEESIHHSIRRIAATRGHPVDCVKDAEDAVARVRENPYDLVFMDNLYPGGSGTFGSYAIMQIRQFNPDVPIYLMSSEDLKAEAEESGANGFIPKDFPAFLHKVVRVIESHEGED